MSAEVELGWATITPCSKIEWVSSDIPGVKVPVIRTTEQRLHAFAIINSDNMRNEALETVKNCALAAMDAAGGINAITDTENPITDAVRNTFNTAFLTCFAASFADIIINNIRLETRFECVGW